MIRHRPGAAEWVNSLCGWGFGKRTLAQHRTAHEANQSRGPCELQAPLVRLMH
jgi:hypothetical protein